MINSLINFRILYTIAIVACLAALSVFLPRLQLTNEYAAQLGAEYPPLLNYQALENDYTSEDTVLIALSPDKGSVFQPSVLDIVEQITEASWKVPSAQRVDSVTNFQHADVDGDDVLIENLFENPLYMTTGKVSERRQVALNEPSLLNSIVSADGRATAINITMKFSSERDPEAIKAAAVYVRAMVNGFASNNTDISFYLSGKTMQDNAYYAAGASDGKWLFPLVFAVMGVVLLAGFRSVYLVAAVMLCTAVAVVGAAGVIALSGVPYTVEGTAALVMIIPLAMADCIHIIFNYLQALSTGIATKRESINKSIRLNAVPILVTTLTTAIGFYSLNFAASPPIRLIGNTVGTGMIFALASSMVLLPGMLQIIQPKTAHLLITDSTPVQSLANWVIRKRVYLLSLFCVLVILSIGALQLNTLDQTSSESFKSTNTYRQDADWINSHLTGIERANFVVGSTTSMGISDPDYLYFLDQYATWLREQPFVRNVNSFSDVIKRLNRILHDNNDQNYSIPEDANLISQYLLFYEQSLPYGLDLTNQVSFDRTASRMIITLGKLSNREIVNFETSALLWFEENAPPGIVIHSASPSTMFSHQINRNIEGIVKGLLFTVALVALVIMITLKSWKLGLLSLIVNLAPMGMAFGIWGVFRGDVGLLVVIAITVTLGIVVDDSVHLLLKYRTGKTAKHNKVGTEEAVSFAMKKTAGACLLSTIAVALGFAVLTQSEFTPHADMGAMCAIIVLWAWLIDFLVLPAALTVFDSNQAQMPSSKGYLA